MSSEKNQGILIIQDNGSGFPEELKSNHPRGFGLQIVEMLSKQLGGTYLVVDEKGIKNILKFAIQ